MDQHRGRFVRLRGGGDFQLNYRDHDNDDLLSILEPEPSLLRRGIFRWRKMRSLSKALFPPVEEGYLEETYHEGANNLEPYDQLGVLTKEDVVGSSVENQEEVIELPESVLFRRPMSIASMKRKKRSQVTVKNIHELHEAILDKGFELRDVELDYSPPPSLLTSKKQQLTTSDKVIATDDSSLADRDGAVPMDSELASNVGDMPRTEWSTPGFELEDNNDPNAEEWQLIGNVLAEDTPFSKEEGDDDDASAHANQLFSHDVLNLLHKRYHSRSTPAARAPDDKAVLALSIEGGGMRGAVSGGMAAAIACLGLSDAFDAIYGSSAGSIIGSYFVSRQLYLDVYTDLIPGYADLFVNKAKIFGDIFVNMFHVVKAPLGKKLNANVIERFMNPAAAGAVDALPPTRAGGLNISFVLDSIMCPERGLRPLDLETFAHNDAILPLRIVSSAVEVESGKLKYVCFGSKEGNFRDQFVNQAANTTDCAADSDYLYPNIGSSEVDKNGYRRGIWASLGASMTVPGAAGSPFRMDLPGSEMNGTTPHLCFDAFCYEPVPFRSAVEEGATHVLALRSRPAGFEPKTKPTLYERAVAPLYFRSHNANTVAEFFEKGGQQYMYAEDILLCDQGLNSSEAIPIPPPKVLYAAPKEQAPTASDKDRDNWARAHLLPITVPADVPELAVLSQDRDEILEGIRSGFAAAYDALAPVVGLEVGPGTLDGKKVAELVFPKANAQDVSVLGKQFPLAGEKLGKANGAAPEQATSSSIHTQETATNADLSSSPRRSSRFHRLLAIRRNFRFKRRAKVQPTVETPSLSMLDHDTSPSVRDADALWSFLPGVQLGSLPMVAERLQTYLENHSFLEG